jgi:hypothetical protein
VRRPFGEQFRAGAGADEPEHRLPVLDAQAFMSAANGLITIQ